MATYRLSVSTVSRSTGRSAVAAAAYRAADRLTNERDGRTHDYRRRQRGIAGHGMAAPDQAPAWCLDRAALWNGAEAAENRKNSVTARDVVVSLPHELDDGQRLELVNRFARSLAERYGVAVDFAVHRPDPRGDDRNHHAHLLMTTRRIEAEGFAAKTRELDDRKTGEIERMRAEWAELVNQALERANIAERVDHRSYERQGIDKTPEPKLGPAAAALERFGTATLKGAWQQAVRRRDDSAAGEASAAYRAAMMPRWKTYAAATAQRKAQEGRPTRRATHLAAELFPPPQDAPLQPEGPSVSPSPKPVNQQQARQDQEAKAIYRESARRLHALEKEKGRTLKRETKRLDEALREARARDRPAGWFAKTAAKLIGRDLDAERQARDRERAERRERELARIQARYEQDAAAILDERKRRIEERRAVWKREKALKTIYNQAAQEQGRTRQRPPPAKGKRQEQDRTRGRRLTPERKDE
jgi:hypothetical protein